MLPTTLIPASIPFRFFAAALAINLLAWVAAAGGAEHVVAFAGGPGAPLAALHLVTLGVLTSTLVGAAGQLLPVALRVDPGPLWPLRAAGWLLPPGALPLAWGMAVFDEWALALGGTMVGAGLVCFLVAAVGALRRADLGRKEVRLVAGHLGAALMALLVMAGLGLALLGDFTHGYLADHLGTAVLHLVLACYGFLGLSAMGFSLLLVPMFALGPAAPERPAWAALGLAVGGLALAVAGAFAAAAVLGLAAAGLHAWLLARCLRARMRRSLGPSFVLVRAAAGFLVASLVLGLLLALGRLPGWGPAAFVVVLVHGWLLSLVLGMLQRILPFLATLHAARSGRRLPRGSELAHPWFLRAQAAGHLAAVGLVLAGLVLGEAAAVRLGALSGAAAAAAFILFALDLRWRVLDLPHARRAAQLG